MSSLGSPSVEVVVNDRAITGESPMWSAREGALYWLDTRVPRIYRLHVASGKRDSWDPPGKVNALGLKRGGLVCAMKNGIWYLDTATGAFEAVNDPEANVPDSRANDGKTDRGGRFWFSSMKTTARRRPVCCTVSIPIAACTRWITAFPCRTASVGAPTTA